MVLGFSESYLKNFLLSNIAVYLKTKRSRAHVQFLQIIWSQSSALVSDI